MYGVEVLRVTVYQKEHVVSSYMRAKLPSQFRDIPYFMARHCKFAMKLAMCSAVNFNSAA
jgi:hypothetical protein